jgi:hypothetical protein
MNSGPAVAKTIWTESDFDVQIDLLVQRHRLRKQFIDTVLKDSTSHEHPRQNRHHGQRDHQG